PVGRRRCVVVLPGAIAGKRGGLASGAMLRLISRGARAMERREAKAKRGAKQESAVLFCHSAGVGSLLVERRPARGPGQRAGRGSGRRPRRRNRPRRGGDPGIYALER